MFRVVVWKMKGACFWQSGLLGGTVRGSPIHERLSRVRLVWVVNPTPAKLCFPPLADYVLRERAHLRNVKVLQLCRRDDLRAHASRGSFVSNGMIPHPRNRQISARRVLLEASCTERLVRSDRREDLGITKSERMASSIGYSDSNCECRVFTHILSRMIGNRRSSWMVPK